MNLVLLSQNDDNSYLAHSKLSSVFAGFYEIFDTVHRSKVLQKNLDRKMLSFIELYVQF